jgi:hypothetical protein
MSSGTITELSDLVEEWLRVDRVRANGVLTPLDAKAHRGYD